MDRFDVVEAYFAYLSDYHSGQGSIEYKRLSKILSYYKPSPLFKGYESLSDESKEIYISLAIKETEKQFCKQDEYKQLGLDFSQIFWSLVNLYDGLDFSDCEDDELIIDVRLRVYACESTNDYGYELKWGNSQFDTDHRGFWGFSSVNDEESQESLLGIASELLNGCLANFFDATIN